MNIEQDKVWHLICPICNEPKLRWFREAEADQIQEFKCHNCGIEMTIKNLSVDIPDWYKKFEERNKHLLSEDGKFFVFSAENPLILEKNCYGNIGSIEDII